MKETKAWKCAAAHLHETELEATKCEARAALSGALPTILCPTINWAGGYGYCSGSQIPKCDCVGRLLGAILERPQRVTEILAPLVKLLARVKKEARP